MLIGPVESSRLPTTISLACADTRPNGMLARARPAGAGRVEAVPNRRSAGRGVNIGSSLPCFLGKDATISSGRAAGESTTEGGEAKPMSDPPVLETRGLEKRFGGVRAVAGVDFTMKPGELRCLIGPNGAGKSTFFKLVTGQHRATAGRILSGGVELTGLPAHEIGRLGIGIKNQVPSVFDGLTVAENLWIGARRRHGAGQAQAVV